DGMRAVFAGYTARKRARQLCDFDDLLLLVRALGRSEIGARVLAGLFDHVLVDEYQDVNALQADLVDQLRPGGRGVTAVGEGAQAEAVCDSVLAHREAGVALREQVVLFRAGHHAATLELALGRRRIPYVKYGGLRFLEAAHVKDLLSLLRMLDNPHDELAWFRRSEERRVGKDGGC